MRYNELMRVIILIIIISLGLLSRAVSVDAAFDPAMGGNPCESHQIQMNADMTVDCCGEFCGCDCATLNLSSISFLTDDQSIDLSELESLKSDMLLDMAVGRRSVPVSPPPKIVL